MAMNFSWLEDFLALAATGNFSRAAEDRHMTQPAFSRRIRALEQWLGVDLFDRRSQPAQLTAAGEWFKGVAREQLRQVAHLPSEARAVAEAHTATLRFAATHALSFTFLPAWLRGLEAVTAVGPVSLLSDVHARCAAMLLEGQVQFVMTHAWPQGESELTQQGCVHVDIGEDRLMPVSAAEPQGHPSHPLTAGTAAPLQILSYSEESGLGQILREVHGDALGRLNCQSPLQAHLASVLRTMTLDGRGLAWLPHSLIADDLAAGRLVAAASDDWAVTMAIRLYRSRRPMAAAAEKFWTTVVGQD